MRILITVLAVLAFAALPMAAAQQKSASPASAAKASAPTPESPLNINTATQAQFEALPGLGAKVAERIIEYRQKNGNFKKVEDLMNVKGIGEKSFLKLKPLLTVSQKADAASSK
jgi:competence protein ComEA